LCIEIDTGFFRCSWWEWWMWCIFSAKYCLYYLVFKMSLCSCISSNIQPWL